jgi:hypothetical protein
MSRKHDQDHLFVSGESKHLDKRITLDKKVFYRNLSPQLRLNRFLRRFPHAMFHAMMVLPGDRIRAQRKRGIEPHILDRMH